MPVDFAVEGFADGNRVRSVAGVIGEPKVKLVEEMKTCPVDHAVAVGLVFGAEEDRGSEDALKALGNAAIVPTVFRQPEEVQYLRGALEMYSASLLAEREGSDPDRKAEIWMSDEVKEKASVAPFVDELILGNGTEWNSAKYKWPLYYVWANLYGASQQAWDDARLVLQVGGDAEDAMELARGHGIFVVDGSECRLALLPDRAQRRDLGLDPEPPLVDALHRALLLWKDERRSDRVAYLAERGLLEDGPFWKLAQSLFEVFPHGLEDWRLVSALLGERETLRAQGKRMVAVAAREEADTGLFRR